MRLRRGRSMKSCGRISFHRSTTSFDFEKKRWPPMSNRNSFVVGGAADAADVNRISLDDGRRYTRFGQQIAGRQAGRARADHEHFGMRHVVCLVPLGAPLPAVGEARPMISGRTVPRSVKQTLSVGVPAVTDPRARPDLARAIVNRASSRRRYPAADAAPGSFRLQVNRGTTLDFCLAVLASGKPLHTFPRHAL